MKEQVLFKFGNRIRELRLAKGMSQEELADSAGVHRTYIGMIERAEKNIALSNIKRIISSINPLFRRAIEDK